jgi:hypothetical protein
MATTQPEAASSEAADALIDRFLDVSEPSEDTPKEPRKPAKPDRSETRTSEEEPDDEGDAAPSEGDEEDEDTDQPDDAGEPDEDDQSEEDSEEGRFVGQNGKVKLPDGSTTTVAELLRGNLRMADYTRKTQETGALFQELQARSADYAQQNQIVSMAIDIMAAALPPEPDVRLLEPGDNNDPIGFQNQRLRWEEASRQLQAMQQAKQQMDQRNEQIQGTLLRRYALEQKDKLLSYKPELAKRDKLEAYHSDLLKTLQYYGKSEEDLSQVYDADIIRMIEDLGNYRKILSARKAARRKAQGAPVLAPSTRQVPQGKAAKTRAKDWDQLRKTGGHRGTAGEAALDRILDDLI